MCTHCGESVHSKLRCYEIIGYPDWWDFLKKPRKKLPQSQATVATSSQNQEGSPVAAHTSTNQGKSSSKSQKDSDWIIATGATDHMINNPNLLTTSYTSKQPKQLNIYTASGDIEKVTAEGTVKVSSSMELDSVLVVPSLSTNLLSVSQITKALNCYVTFWPNDCVFQDMETHQIHGYGTRRGRIYYLEEGHQSQANHAGVARANKSLAMLWHRRLGHLSFTYLRKLKPNLFFNISDNVFSCDICELSKNKRIYS